MNKEITTKLKSYKTKICNWCCQSSIIWVHGHGQCSNCGYNIDECCRGESCANSELSEIKKEEAN